MVAESVVFFSHSYRGDFFRVGSHHLSVALAKQGYRVAHISTPVSLVHFVLRNDPARLQKALQGAEIADGVVDLVPRSILPSDLVWNRFQAKAALRKVGIPVPDFIFVDQPKMLRNTRWLKSLGTTVVFRPTDKFMGSIDRRLAGRISRSVDGIAATSQSVLDSLPCVTSVPTCVIENGADLSHFAHARRDSRKSNTVIYIGAVDCRFDSDIVRRAAKLRPQYQFEIFGGSQIVDHGNLRYRGSIPYDDLPSVLRSAKVGILPLSDYPSNKGRSPMKLFEYLSSGLTVVAPDYIAERHPGLPAIFGYTAGSLESFVETLDSAIASQDVPMNIADSQIPDSVDWENKATELMTFARYAAQKREPVE